MKSYREQPIMIDVEGFKKIWNVEIFVISCQYFLITRIVKIIINQMSNVLYNICYAVDLIHIYFNQDMFFTN